MPAVIDRIFEIKRHENLLVIFLLMGLTSIITLYLFITKRKELLVKKITERHDDIDYSYSVDRIGYNGGTRMLLKNHFGKNGWDLSSDSGTIYIIDNPVPIGCFLFRIGNAITEAFSRGVEIRILYHSNVPVRKFSKQSFDDPLFPERFTDIFVKIRPVHVEYELQSSPQNEKDILELMFPKVILQTGHEIIYHGEADSNLFLYTDTDELMPMYPYRKSINEQMEPQEQIKKYCHSHYNHIYSGNLINVGLFANYSEDQMWYDSPSFDIKSMKNAIRDIYIHSGRPKRLFLNIFTRYPETAKEMYGSIFNVHGIHPIIITDIEPVVLELCRNLRYLIIDNDRFSKWCGMCSDAQNNSNIYLYGQYVKNDIPSRWRMITK